MMVFRKCRISFPVSARELHTQTMLVCCHITVQHWPFTTQIVYVAPQMCLSLFTSFIQVFLHSLPFPIMPYSVLTLSLFCVRLIHLNHICLTPHTIMSYSYHQYRLLQCNDRGWVSNIGENMRPYLTLSTLTLWGCR